MPGLIGHLSQHNAYRHLQPQSVPLVIDGYNLALDCLAGGVTQLAEKVAVEPPLKVHRALGEDLVFVFGIVGNPLAID